MQYTDYISQETARREREQQLLNKYNQSPKHKPSNHLWLMGSEKHTFAQPIEVLKIISGLGLVLAIFIIWCLS